MDFTSAFKYSGLAEFSPDGSMLANSAGVRLCIRDVQSLEMIKLHTCVDKIGHLEWSSCSKYVLCVLMGRAVVQFFAIDSMNQIARIDEGLGGLRAAKWLPSGRHVITLSDFGMRLTIWSLTNKEDIKQIKQPKLDEAQQLIIDFTQDLKYAALVQRRDCKDNILVLDLDHFVVMRRWDTDNSSDIQSLNWSPDGCHICCIDCMFLYRAFIYSLDGKLLSVITNPNAVLGINTFEWSNDSRLIVLGGYDGQCKVVSHITWKDFATLDHPPTIAINTAIIFQEQEYCEEDITGQEVKRCQYVVCEQPFQVPQRPGGPDKLGTKVGIRQAQFSPDGVYLCTVLEQHPTCVWIWAMRRMALEALVVQMKPVKAVHWDPVHTRLGICTGAKRFYLWSPGGCTCVDTVHPDFAVQAFGWSADGAALVLEDKLAFCLAYPNWTDL
mmetsp:Transcript_26229/g.47281  ORF Transcript_26229/g.47281 Transcript_26229/m.47281 type:complete len:439 (-) Transcript_26229:339-1655(-)